jgi:hypothetical protein
MNDVWMLFYTRYGGERQAMNRGWLPRDPRAVTLWRGATDALLTAWRGGQVCIASADGRRVLSKSGVDRW